MKAEENKTAPSTPATKTPTVQPTPVATTTPAPTYIPYQHYQPYSSHYPQAAYGHYQYATPLTTQAMQAQLLRTSAATTPTTVPTAQPTAVASTVDTADIATLNDALGSAGVDLRAEEESLQRSHDQHQPYRPYEDRTRKQHAKPSFDATHLGTKMHTIGTSHKVTRIPEDSINYLALALRARLQDLISNMIGAAHHRTDTQFDRPASLYSDNTPMWRIVVRSDVAKQLAALEKVEREEEMRVRRERKERAEMTAAHAAALAAQANGAAVGAADATSGTNGAAEEEGGAKKKRKKDGPGVTARNMSEDVRKKMSNAVATQAAGLGGKYAWMTAAANANSPAPKLKGVVATPAPTTATTAAMAAMAATAATAATTGTTATPTSPLTTTTTTTTMTTTTTTTTTTTAAVTASTSMTTPAVTGMSAPTASTPTAGNAVTTATAGPGASSWAKPYVPTKRTPSTTTAQMSMEEDTRTVVTMRDAIFVIEKERGHGGGRGAARGFI